MDNYQRGDLLPALWTPLGSSTPVNVNVKGWSFDDSLQLHDVTGTRHNGRGTARIAGKGDAGGNFTLHVDADQAPHGATLNLHKGSSGILAMCVNAAKQEFIQQPMIVEKVHYESSVESDEVFNLDWKENILAGVKVYPTDP